MGYLSALDFAQNADLETALHWHLRANHFPPLPEDLVPAAKEAIENARADNWNEPVHLRGVSSYKGEPSAPTWACVEGWHLDAFLEALEETEEA